MSLRHLLGTRLPIIQAPMAGSQNHRLAAAVGQAGGLGSLPAAMLSSAALADEISATRALSDAPLNVNFFCHQQPEPNNAVQSRWQQALAPYFSELGVDIASIAHGLGRLPFDQYSCAVVEACQPEVVSFHFGLPDAALLARVRASGATILSSATTLKEALWLQANGADAVIAQGLEAGGHRGHFLDHNLSRQLGTFALLPQLARVLDIPVIAAGGIVDAAGVRAAMALGAAGVQVGTAYLLCPEANTSAVHRTALQGSNAQHTALTNLFSGRPARGIVNRLMREIGPLSNLAPEFPLATAAIAPLRSAAEAQGSADFSPLWAGQNAPLCRAMSAAQLTAELAKGLD